MIDKLVRFLFGGRSKRMRMTLLYTTVFVLLTVCGKIEPISFGTFSGLFGVWIHSEGSRKGQEE